MVINEGGKVTEQLANAKKSQNEKKRPCGENCHCPAAKRCDCMSKKD